MDAAVRQLYSLSDHGFLPPALPLACLPDAYYAPWESVIARLPALLRDNALRHAVRQLPTLATDRLATEPEWRRAYVVLAFLAHGYIWGGDAVADVLPPCIAVPLLAVSAHLELPPVATYAALNLWNFATTRADAALDDLDALTALHTFTGTESESWFFVVSVAMECRAAKTLPVLLGALQAAAAACEPGAAASAVAAGVAGVTAALRHFVTCIEDVGVLLDRMHERCDPTTFFFQIRPFLAGSKNMAAQGLPRGVFYDEGDGAGAWRQLRGGSNGQSSLIQFFDVVLGVEHTSSGTPSKEPAGPERGFHQEVRDYMPGPHRRFLEHAARMPSLRDFVARVAVEEDDGDTARGERLGKSELLAAFQDATTALAAFRNRHLAIVTRYIVIPSRQKPPSKDADAKPRGLASNVQVPHPDAPAALTGTGGTELVPFLKQTRDETLQAGLWLGTGAAACSV